MLAVAFFAGRFWLRKKRRKMNLRKAKQPVSKSFPELACSGNNVRAIQSVDGIT